MTSQILVDSDLDVSVVCSCDKNSFRRAQGNQEHHADEGGGCLHQPESL